MARRRNNIPTQRETRGLIALIAGIVLLFAKIAEYLLKVIASSIKYIANDVSWAKDRVRNYPGGWSDFYDAEFNKTVFKYIAITSVVIGLLLLPERLLAGCLFILVATIAFFLNINLFLKIGKRAKELVLVALIGAGLVSNGYYQQAENLAIKQDQENTALQLRKEVAYQKEQVAKIDSSNKLVTLGKKALFSKNYKKADILLSQALTFSPTNDNALYYKGLYFKETKKTDKAVSLFSQVSSTSENYDESLVNQGLCLISKGKKEQAIHFFKDASTLNNKLAEKLYDKYNPVRKQITGYYTECYDGTSSNATGRGACSHHGGVRNWNKPIFSESRRYE